jgi:hypothetical protein
MDYVEIVKGINFAKLSFILEVRNAQDIKMMRLIRELQ